jgi:hypothetical protein
MEMPKMTNGNIVEHLRSIVRAEPPCPLSKLLEEAADRIEALEATLLIRLSDRIEALEAALRRDILGTEGGQSMDAAAADNFGLTSDDLDEEDEIARAALDKDAGK